MKKNLLILFLIPILSLAQTQIRETIVGARATDLFGNAVSLSSNGRIVAIGARENDDNGENSGHVRVYKDIPGGWTQIGSDINGDAAGDLFGISVSLSSDGSVLAIGAPGNDTNGENSGHVRVYRNESGTWTQIGSDIDGEAAGDNSGRSVSLSSDGNIVAIGATKNNGNGFESGHVRVYRNESGIWTQIGSDIDGEVAGDNSGISVSLSSNGNVLAIGATGNDGNGENSGHVRIYRNESETWTQIGTDIDGEAAGDISGWSVSLSADGNIVAIGARYNGDNGSNSGHVRVYRNESEVWRQIGNDIDGSSANDESGYSVSLSSNGNTVAIGAPFVKVRVGVTTGSIGSFRIFQNISGTWTQAGSEISRGNFGSQFGSSVSLSSDGNTLAVGGPHSAGSRFRTGFVRIFNLSPILSTGDDTISSFNLFPNPARDQFTIQFSDNDLLKNVSVYDNLGRLVLSTKNTHIDTSSMNTGLYIVRIETEQGSTSKKLIIE